MMLKHGILGLLNYGDMTGYEIREIFNKSLNFFWQAQSSQIYRELRTLEKNGWITITTVEQSEKPNKNVCSITEDGRTELLSWLSTQNPIGDTRVPLLMQVFFLGNRSKEENIASSKVSQVHAASSWPPFPTSTKASTTLRANSICRTKVHTGK